MTRDQLVTAIMERLNLTSSTATTRVQSEVQQVYGQILDDVGLGSATRTTVTANTSIGSRMVTFTANKLLNVYNANVSPIVMLAEVSPDEMRNYPVQTDPPTAYAVWNSLATTVAIMISSAAESVYALSADVRSNAGTLSGSGIPVFPVNYHDVIIDGVMTIELDKMEKGQRAGEHQARFDARMAKLKYYIAMSGYLKQFQSKDASSPWLAGVGL